MLDNHRFSPEALVLDSEGNKIGHMKIGQAKSLAREQGLDLVEIDRQGNLSVVRIMDKGKWLYEQKKNAKKQVQHSAPQKEMKFRMRIDPHDLTIKCNKIQKFLEKGSDVHIVIEMRGRERANPSFAEEFMNKIIGRFPDSKVDKIKKTRSNVSTILHPSIRGHHAESTSSNNTSSNDKTSSSDNKQS